MFHTSSTVTLPSPRFSASVWSLRSGTTASTHETVLRRVIDRLRLAMLGPRDRLLAGVNLRQCLTFLVA